jgi:cytoskeletal protein RodZ
MSDLGERLRQARLGAGFSIREISSRTKIREHLLDAIEREDFAQLPAGLVGRGFLRAYAREVGLDPESVVRQFRDQFEVDATPSEPTPAEAAGDSDHVEASTHLWDGTRLWWWGVLVVAGLAVTMGGVTYVIHRADIEGNSGSEPIASSGSPEISPARLSLEPEDTVERLPEVTAAAVNTSGGDFLAVVIDPTRLVWVEATADGSRVLYQLVKPGERRSIDVREELLLRIGDAGAFRFSINGVPGRTLGRSGEVRDIRITKDDHSSFQAR